MKNVLDASTKVVFFDGVCGLCNFFVDFLIPKDPNAKLRFAALQSDFALTNLPEDYRKLNEAGEFESVVFWDGERFWERSEAVLEVFRALGGFYVLLLVLYGVPAFIRDSLYGLVARNRYRWFGKKGQCRIPNAEERRRFLP
jgi:predicted DCC family thiol-disulfide oxidoreductase YuxK